MSRKLHLPLWRAFLHSEVRGDWSNQTMQRELAAHNLRDRRNQGIKAAGNKGQCTDVYNKDTQRNPKAMGHWFFRLLTGGDHEVDTVKELRKVSRDKQAQNESLKKCGFFESIAEFTGSNVIVRIKLALTFFGYTIQTMNTALDTFLLSFWSLNCCCRGFWTIEAHMFMSIGMQVKRDVLGSIILSLRMRILIYAT